MIEETLDIATRDGAMETFLCRPERGGPFPAVFFLMDAPGIREELRDMARRLGTIGYCMLLPHLLVALSRIREDDWIMRDRCLLRVKDPDESTHTWDYKPTRGTTNPHVGLL